MLHFKSPDDWLAYSRDFGQGHIFDGMVAHQSRAALNASQMEILGPNPGATLQAVLDTLRRRVDADDAIAPADKLGVKEGLSDRGQIGAAFRIASGAAMIPVSRTWADILGGVRAAQSMAKLGGAVVSSITDLPTAIVNLRFNGLTFGEATGGQVREFLRGRGAGERKELAYLLGEGFDGLIGHITNPFVANDGAPGAMQSAMSTFFRWTGLSWWTDANRAAAARVLSAHLGRNAGLEFSQLDARLQHVFRQHSITPEAWDLIRTSGLRVIDGRTYIVPDQVVARTGGGAAPAVRPISAAPDITPEDLRAAGAGEDANLFTRSQDNQIFMRRPGGGPDLGWLPELDGITGEAGIRVRRQTLDHLDNPAHRQNAQQFGYRDGIHLLLDVTENWDRVLRQEDRNHLVLARELPGTDRKAVAILELRRADGEDYWRVTTSGIRRPNQMAKMETIHVRERTPNPSSDQAGPSVPPDGMVGNREGIAQGAERAEDIGPSTADIQNNREMEEAMRSAQLALRRYYADEVASSVLEADAATQRFTTGGFQRGTWAGEAIRFIMQFKAFPIAFTQRVIGRAYQGGQEGSTAGAAHIGTLIAGTLVMGYAAMTAKDAIRGYAPRELVDEQGNPRLATILAALVQGGGAGIYGDFLFGEVSRSGNSALENVAGPVLSDAARAVNLITRARDGDAKTADALTAIIASTPFANVFYARPVLDYLILNDLRNTLSPGYLQRQDQRRREQFGQEPLPFLRSPSDRVAVDLF